MTGGRGLIGRNGLCTLIECEPVRPPKLWPARTLLLTIAVGAWAGVVAASWWQ
jgi:hypothetical protein